MIKWVKAEKDKPKLTKCDFCKYFVGNGCTARPNSFYCQDATNEFTLYLSELKKKGYYRK